MSPVPVRAVANLFNQRSKEVNKAQNTNQYMKSILNMYQKNNQTLIQHSVQPPIQTPPQAAPMHTPVTPPGSIPATSQTPLPLSVQLNQQAVQHQTPANDNKWKNHPKVKENNHSTSKIKRLQQCNKS